LCFLQKFSRYLDSDFSRGWHSGLNIPYSIPVFNMVTQQMQECR
jgi:hypothetical protein